MILEFQLQNTSRGKGFWKLNTSLLHDIEYVNLVKNVIRDTIQTYTKSNGPNDHYGYNLSLDYITLFEMLKLNVRGQTIAYGSRKSKERNKIVSTLEQKIKKLENSLQDLAKSENPFKILQAKKELDEAKSDLIKVCEPLVKAAILRSKCQYYEEGEKSTKFFCNLEKRNFVNKTIYKLNVDGKIITSPIEILKEQKTFYKKL